MVAKKGGEKQGGAFDTTQVNPEIFAATGPVKVLRDPKMVETLDDVPAITDSGNQTVFRMSSSTGLQASEAVGAEGELRFADYLDEKKSARDYYKDYLEVLAKRPDCAEKFWYDCVAFLHQQILCYFSPDALLIDENTIRDDFLNKLVSAFKLAWHRCLTEDLRRLVLQQAFNLAQRFDRTDVFDIVAFSFNSASFKKETPPVEGIKQLFYEEEIPYPENPHTLPIGADFKKTRAEIGKIDTKIADKFFTEHIEELNEVLEEARNFSFPNSKEPMPWPQYQMLCIVRIQKVRSIRTKLQSACLGRLWKEKKETERQKLLAIIDKVEAEIVAAQLVGYGEIIYSKSLLMPYAA